MKERELISERKFSQTLVSGYEMDLMIMKVGTLLFCSTIFYSLECCKSSNILVMLPHTLPGHARNFMALFREMAIRGHNVTVVSPFPQKQPVPNFKDIVVRNVYDEIMSKQVVGKDFSQIKRLIYELVGIWITLSKITEMIMQEKPVQKIISDTTSSYDVVITETFRGNEVFAALGHKYSAPVINIHSSQLFPTIADLTGNHMPPAYVPNFRLPFTDRMEFWQRLINTVLCIWDKAFNHFFYLRKQEALMRKYFVYPGSENLPPIADLLRNTSLTITETNKALTYPHPLQKNVVEVGGINMNIGSDLPAELKAFMDRANEGVIYFSLGSNFKTTSLTKGTLNIIVSVLGKLKQKVLMKWEEDKEFPGKADNILTKKWFPQTSILEHPNCRLFITHGTWHGLLESMFNGVPLLGLPLLGDQKYNIKIAVSFGAAIQINLDNISEESFLNAVNTMLNDPSYSQNAKKRSQLMKDQPMSPMETAIYWIEYVIRHKGASHLRPAVVDMPLYQYLLLDVASIFAFGSLVVSVIFYYGVKLLLKLARCRCCRKLIYKRYSKGKSKQD